MTFTIGCQSHIKCTYIACIVTRVILTRFLEEKNQNFGLLACRIFGVPGAHCTTQRGKPCKAELNIRNSSKQRRKASFG